MGSNDTLPTRRSVLKATGTAIGVAFGASGSGAAKCRVVTYDAPAWNECPGSGSRDGIISEGTYVFAECADDDGTLYYFGQDDDFAGYVPEAYVGPCS